MKFEIERKYLAFIFNDEKRSLYDELKNCRNVLMDDAMRESYFDGVEKLESVLLRIGEWIDGQPPMSKQLDLIAPEGYDDECITMSMKWCKRNDAGVPEVNEHGQYIFNKTPESEAAMEIFKIKYKDHLENVESQRKARQEYADKTNKVIEDYLNIKEDIKFIKVEQEHFPKMMSPEQHTILHDLFGSPKQNKNFENNKLINPKKNPTKNQIINMRGEKM